VDPYVKVFLLTTARPTEITKLIRTEIVGNNGFNPVWKKNSSSNFQVIEGEINMLLIKVKDDDKTLLCWNVLVIDCLKNGYRAIPMRDPNFVPLSTTSILCKLDIN
jgi:hypothetical protein